MRAYIALFFVLGAAACQPESVQPPADAAPYAGTMTRDCSLNEILSQREFVAPDRERADQSALAACIAAGGNLEELSDWGRTPLTMAAYWGDEQSLRRLIAAGADVNARRNTANHPVASMTIQDDNDMLAILLAAGSNPDGSGKRDAPQPLGTAIWNNNIDGVRLLIEAGANVAIRDLSNGHSMVERTILSDEDNGEILLMLFQAGLSPTAPLSRGRAPLERVIWKVNAGEMRALVRAGVDLNAPLGRAESALFYLTDACDMTPQFIRALVQAGADTTQQDELGDTPYSRAQRYDPGLAVKMRQAGLR